MRFLFRFRNFSIIEVLLLAILVANGWLAARGLFKEVLGICPAECSGGICTLEIQYCSNVYSNYLAVGLFVAAAVYFSAFIIYKIALGLSRKSLTQ